MRSFITNCKWLVETAKRDGVGRLVVGAVIEKNGRVLIVKRAPTESFLPDIEEIPGGQVEENESILEALARETLEETGLKVDTILRYVNYFDYRSKSGSLTRQFNFAVTVDPNKHVVLNTDEHVSYRWINSTDVQNTQCTRSVKESLYVYFSTYKEHLNAQINYKK